MAEEQRYRIVRIARGDRFFGTRHKYIGREGTVRPKINLGNGWVSGRFNFGTENLYFYKILLKKLGKRKILVE